MKTFNRRDFIRSATMALGAMSLSGLPVSCGRKADTRFKYAFCNEILEDMPWPEQCEVIARAGYTGVEIAPFTLVEEGVGELGPARRRQMVQNMNDAGIQCAGLHWLFVAPPEGLHFTTPEQRQRQRTVSYLLELIDFCADMEGEVLVFGSPGQRGTTSGTTVEEAKNYLTEGLAAVADRAQQNGVKVLLEPLPQRSTDVVNTLAEALEIVGKIDHPAISTMFDFHNTLDETLPMHDLIRRYFKHIHHVHFQNMDGTLVYSDDIPAEFIRVFEELKSLNYEKWISLEVFDYTPGGVFIAEEGMRTFLEIERQI